MSELFPEKRDSQAMLIDRGSLLVGDSEWLEADLVIDAFGRARTSAALWACGASADACIIGTA